MVKKCVICNKEAVYKIKDISNYYCDECAKDNFSDLNLLITVEEEAQRLKRALKDKLEELENEVDKISEKCVKQSDQEN